MKHCLLLLGMCFTQSIYAQIPEGYYNSTAGVSGQALKDSLHNIIKNHVEFPYTSSNTDVWDILKNSDKDIEDPENVILFYSGWSVNAAQEYNSGSGWSREHVWAKSRGDFGTTKGAGTDAHHLRPADVSINSARNNRWFHWGEKEYLDQGVSTQNFTSDYNWVWEPRNEVKGDVARMLFYMATRYTGENGEPNLSLVDYLPSDKFTQEPIHAILSTLLEWHKLDPVDAFEQNRNEVVYSYQLNRNPFIDYPMWVEDIFSLDTANTVLPTTPTNIILSNITSSKVNLRWDIANNNIASEYHIYLDDNFLMKVNRNSASLVGLQADTQYNVKVTALNKDEIESAYNDTVFVTLNEAVNILEKKSQKIEVYPNPFQAKLIVQSELVGDNCIITNIHGKIVLQEKLYSNQQFINTGQLKSGLYTLTISDDNKRISSQNLLKIE
jgi:endonuclease I